MPSCSPQEAVARTRFIVYLKFSRIYRPHLYGYILRTCWLNGVGGLPHKGWKEINSDICRCVLPLHCAYEWRFTNRHPTARPLLFYPSYRKYLVWYILPHSIPRQNDVRLLDSYIVAERAPSSLPLRSLQIDDWGITNRLHARYFLIISSYIYGPLWQEEGKPSSYNEE